MAGQSNHIVIGSQGTLNIWQELVTKQESGTEPSYYFLFFCCYYFSYLKYKMAFSAAHAS